MAEANPDAVIAGIDQMLEFLNAWGDGDARRIAKFRELASQIKNGGLKKDLLKDLDKFRNDNFVKIRDEIWAGHVLSGKDDEQTISELARASGAIYNALFPLNGPPTGGISGFAGSEYVDEKSVQ